MPITRSILETSLNHPDRPAIVGDSAGLTYQELVEDGRRVIAAATHLHALATSPPAPPAEITAPVTAVASTSAFDAARIMAGLAGYHHISATIDPRWPTEHKKHVIAHTGIGLVIVDDEPQAEELRDALGGSWGGGIVSLEEFKNLERSLPPAEHPTVRSGEEPYLMLFSSGTTNNPKAFLKTRFQYRANFSVSSQYLEPYPGIVTFAPGPFSYSLTLYAAVESLASGGTVHLADSFSLTDLGRRIAKHQITRLVTVPAVVKGLITQATRRPQDFASLELVVSGGANFPEAIRDEQYEILPHVRLISYYGAAEIGFIGDARGEDMSWNQIYNDVQVVIRDDNDQPVEDGEIGTIWVKTDSRSDGYVAGTAQQPLLDDNGWATVEDQGRLNTIDGQKYLQLVGRKGDIINTGGHKVALPEVTAAFEGFTANDRRFEAVAVGLPDQSLGSVVGLVFEAGEALDDAESLPTKSDLRQHGQARLAPQFVPTRFYAVRQLPRTVGGKIRVQETSQMVAAAHGTSDSTTGVIRL